MPKVCRALYDAQAEYNLVSENHVNNGSRDCSMKQ